MAPQSPHAPAATATQSSPLKCPAFKNKAEGAASFIAAMEDPHSLSDAVDLIRGLPERGADPLALREPDEQSPLKITVKVHPWEKAKKQRRINGIWQVFADFADPHQTLDFIGAPSRS